ncbi:MAG: hypothetical protein HN366_02620 [Deltaproteobacteria bacterium]|jgi:hypothetical protein|nr:hypothetical protein [Deltaproteobacteria bacterium]
MKLSWNGFLIAVGLSMVLLAACDRQQEKPEMAVVGIVNVTPILEDAV